MTKKIIFVVLTLLSVRAMSQIEVRKGSFQKIPNFVMDDKENHRDGNGDPMALIKITTENISAEDRNKFYFKGNRATEFDAVPKIGELYLYLSAEAATFIEIKHPDFGKCAIDIIETLGEPLEDFSGYEMVIVSNYKIEPKREPQNNYLIINTDQDNAMIYVDDKFIGLNEVSPLLSVDTVHTWRIECDMYETENGEVILSSSSPTILSKELKPKYGYVNITTSPEDSALVFIDRKYVGTTPYSSERIQSGIHDLLVLKDNFKTISQTFEVDSAYTTYLDLDMDYSVVNVTVYADSLSKIYVDNKYKGEVMWNGFLNEGIHLFEARRTNYSTTFVEKEVLIGTNDVIELDEPKPIYSSADINSKPKDVDVYIDGEYKGQTPLFMPEIIIGQHEIKFAKVGYAQSMSIINVEEDEVFSIEENLSEGYFVVIETDTIGDKVYVDEQLLGLSPLEVYLSPGLHDVRIVRGNYIMEDDFFVSREDDNYVKILFNKKITIESDKSGDNVFVDNKLVGTSPCEVIVSYGRHEIKLHRMGEELIVADTTGGISRSKSIVVDKDSDPYVKIPLGKEITITTKEKKNVFLVDNKEIGKKMSSMTMYMPFNEYDITLKKKGRGAVTKRIEVKEKGGLDEYAIYYGQLIKFDSDKVGDVVILDGKKVGHTPLEIDVPVGNHKVIVKRHRELHEKYLTIEEGEDNMAYYTFVPRRETFSEFIDNGVKYFTLNASSFMEQSYAFGVSFGSYREVGWYLSLMTNFDKIGEKYYTGVNQFLSSFQQDVVEHGILSENGNNIDLKLSIMGGIMFELTGPIYLKMGAGYGSYSNYSPTTNDKWKKNKDNSYEGFLLSLGFQFNLRDFILSTEVVTPPDFNKIEIKAGIGLGWKKK